MAGFDDLISGFRSTVFPTSQGAALDRQQERSAQLEAFRRAVLEQMGRGGDLTSSVIGALGDPEIGKVLGQPDFPKNAQEFMELLTPAPEPVVKKTEIPRSTLEALPPRKQERFFGVAGPANVQLIDEIQAAEKVGDAARVERLQRLLQRGENNRITVMDAMRLRLIGVTVDENLSFKGVNDVTSAEAGTALRAGTDARSATDNDLIQAAVAGDVSARQTLKIKTALSQQALDGFMAFFASQSPGFAEFIRNQQPTVDELFEEIDKARGAEGAQGAQEGAQGTKKKIEPPIVGGTGGQASGPTSFPSPEAVLDEAVMSEEEVQALAASLTRENPGSPELADAIVKRLGLEEK